MTRYGWATIFGWGVGLSWSAACFGAGSAVPSTGATEPPVQLLAGASQRISHSLSASRDTALLAYQLTPYSVLTAGGDVALVTWKLHPEVELRFGFFGLIEMESDRAFEPGTGGSVGVLPGAGAALYRGHNGVHLATTFERTGERLFGRGGIVELTLGLHHESEHYMGSEDTSVAERYKFHPHIGDFVLQDAAVRIPAGRVEVDLRLQNKLFVPVDLGQANGHQRGYIIGPGLDLVFRWRLSDWAHPFSSFFGEYLVGNEILFDGRAWLVPDNYLLRNLTGVIFPGVNGDVQVYTSLSVGHGKGLLVLREEFLWGGGVRLALF